MEPRKYNGLSNDTSDIGVLRQTLTYAHEHKRLLSLRGKVEQKCASLSGLRIFRDHNIYHSWININLFRSKMHHSKCKAKSCLLNSGVGKCSCDQTFEYASERDRNMKVHLHCKVCPNPPAGSKHISIPTKALTPREMAAQ